MSNKVFWVDLETSGLDEDKNGILQMAGLIEIDGEIRNQFEYLVKPAESLEIDNEALKVNNFTHREIQAHDPENLVFKDFGSLLTKYVDRYDSDDKFFVGGFNVEFDLSFLTEFWYRHNRGNNHLGSYINRSMQLDPYRLIPDMVFNDELEYPSSMKLEYTAKKYMDNARYDWHDAMADVKASRDLYYSLKDTGD